MTSTSRPHSWAASRIAWRQPPQGVTVPRRAARRPDIAAGDGDPRDLVQAEGQLGGAQRAISAQTPSR